VVELTLTDTMFMARFNDDYYYCVNKQSTQLNMYHLMQHVLSVKVISSLKCLLENIKIYIIAFSIVLRTVYSSCSHVLPILSSQPVDNTHGIRECKWFISGTGTLV
jgi:hypothetical protein